MVQLVWPSLCYVRCTAKTALSSWLASLVNTPSVLSDDAQWMVTTCCRWPSGPSLPLTMKYVQCIKLCGVHNSPQQTGFQCYLRWIWPAALHKISKTGQGSIQEICASILMDGNLHTTISQTDFLSNVKNKDSSDKARDPPHDDCWSRHPTDNIRN